MTDTNLVLSAISHFDCNEVSCAFVECQTTDFSASNRWDTDKDNNLLVIISAAVIV